MDDAKVANSAEILARASVEDSTQKGVRVKVADFVQRTSYMSKKIMVTSTGRDGCDRSCFDRIRGVTVFDRQESKHNHPRLLGSHYVIS